MYQVSIFSNRIYPTKISETIGNQLLTNITSFNKYMYTAYNLCFEKKFNKKYFDSKYKESLHQIIKHKFNINDYYANSILQFAKGKLDSQLKLNKEYIKNNNAKLKIIEKKLIKDEKRLTNLFLIKESLELLQYQNKNSIKPTKFKNYRGSNISLKDNKTIVVRTLNNKKQITKTEYGLYKFEYEYLLPKIRYLKNKIAKLKYAINNIKNKIYNLENKPKRICFASKKLYRTRTKENYLKWREELDFKKYNSFEVSGRLDAKLGNFVFKYENNALTFKTMLNETIVLNNIVFPYLGDELIEATTNKQPVAFGIKIKKDKNNKKYYLVSASFDLERVHKLNHSKSSGIIGVDFNVGHIDWADINFQGNLVDYGRIDYIAKGSSLERELSLRKALKELTLIAKDKKKCIVKEKLNTSNSKNNSKYRNPNLNKTFHEFSYNKYNEFLKSITVKNEIQLFEVHPAYTSVIGKLKYSKQKNLNIHTAAAYVIARRALGFKEKTLKEYKHLIPEEKKHNHHWSKWYHINKEINKLNKKK